MEYRKLIKFGNSSHIVSLPTNWLKKNNLKKGALIYFEENGNGELVLNPRESHDKNVEKEITFDITGKSYNEIRRTLSTAYINNYKIINIIGKDLDEKAKELKLTLQGLMALEVLEQTSKRLVVKDFLDVNSISLDNMVRKIDIIIRSLIEDSKLTVKKDNYEYINQRDEDVNRLTFLILRTVKFALNSPQTAKNFKTNTTDLFGYWEMANCLEQISDETKRISRFITKARLKGKCASDFVTLYSRIESYYLDVMKAYYTSNKDLAIKLTENKKLYIKFYDEFLSKYGNNKYALLLIERLKVMANEIHSILKIVYWLH